MALYQKKIPGLRCHNGVYKPKYSSNRILINENDFIDLLDDSLSYKAKIDSFNEHQLIDILVNKQWKRWANSNASSYERNNLLFYHWYERKYKKNIINSNVLFNINQYKILDLYKDYNKEEIESVVKEVFKKNMKSKRFPDYSIYYENLYDFFPNIESFSFQQFKRKDFIYYLLDMFPMIVAINYMDNKVMWRITEKDINESGDDYHDYVTSRNNTHNPLIYNKFKLPSFHPTNLGERDIYNYKSVTKDSYHNILGDIREYVGLPREKEERWVSESNLFYKIKKSIINYDIIQHAKPLWLGLQHLDIYIPELNIGIEYQGTQHQKPVEYFGGEEAFQKGQERDERKKKLCDENGCKLFYVYPDDDTTEFIKELKKFIKNI